MNPFDKKYSIKVSAELSDSQKQNILNLWNNEYPEEIAYASIEEFNTYLDNLSDHSHYFISDGDIADIGWAMTFKRNNELNFAMIVHSEYQRMGVGTYLIDKIKEGQHKLVGWTIESGEYQKGSGGPYISPIKFYKKNHFEIHSNKYLENAPINAVKISWTQSNTP